MRSDGELSDNTLAARAAAGEEFCFTQLMRRHKTALYKFIRRYVGSSDEAYDLLQESFVAAWLALNRYDESRSFSTWLRSIALNKCRDWSRRRAVRKWLTWSEPIDGLAALAVADASASPEGVLAETQSVAQLDRAIAELPRGLKDALILTGVEGLSHQEAGRILRLSPKAVDLRVYRARKALSEKLKDE